MLAPPEHTWSWMLDTSIPSDIDRGHAVIEELIAALERADWEGRDLFHVRLATEEAVVNAIEHGNKRHHDKTVHLDFRVSPECCYLQITDQGAGFDRATLKDCTDEANVDKPRGRGVMLIEQLMSQAQYNQCGNQLTMFRLRNDPALAPQDD